MKLRNKKTGKVIEALISAYGISGDVAISVRDSNSESGYTDLGRYKNLAELNEEWEDYEPIEPLIKDEKIRTAVRAWAEANGLAEKLRVINEHFDCCKIIGRCDSRNICLDIEFKTMIAHVNENQFYTIDELCGEKEE